MRFFVTDERFASKVAGAKIAEILRKKPGAAIALPTGSTPLGLYRELVKQYRQGKIDFSKAIFMNLDEYAGLRQSHPQSYARFLRKNILGKINAGEKNIFLYNGAAADLKKEAEEREALVKRKGIDLALLGIGGNAHIAFNEPGSQFSSKTRVVKLSASTISANSRFFKSKPEVPRQAITMGLSTIMKAKKIILFAYGGKKAGAVRKMALSKPNESVPASVLQRHPDTDVYCDKDSAALLEDVLPAEYNGVKIFFEENLPKGKKIVFVSPHPDDSAVACGATLSLLSKKNRVFVFVMTTGDRAVYNCKTKERKAFIRERESMAEARALKTKPLFLRLGFYDNGEKSFVADKEKVAKKFRAIRPDIVFLPQAADTHPTHLLARRIASDALAKINARCEIWNYETPWALFSHRKFNAIVQFSEKELRKKILAIKKHASQVSRTRFDTSAKNMARFRGITLAEQILSNFGEKPPTTVRLVELFSIEQKQK
jgi:glucosamine-6-phosphate deaminase